MVQKGSDSGEESGTRKQSRTSSPVPGPSHVLSRDEQINQLMEMFPDSSRENISSCLDVHGTVATAALSLSTTLSNDSYDSDSDHAEPAFQPRPVSLPSLLEELKGGMSDDREKAKSNLQQAACCRYWRGHATVFYPAT